MAEWFGLASGWDSASVLAFALRLALDLVVAVATIRWVYSRRSPRPDFALSCILLNVITFTACMMLRRVPLELGFALSLFGVFGILRYRTDAIGVRDLTYLFVAIGLGLVNSVADKQVSLGELVIVNAAIAGTAALLELAPIGGPRQLHTVLYDNLALLVHARRAELLDDLRKRTGLDVLSVSVDEIDFLRDSARLAVTCRAA